MANILDFISELPINTISEIELLPNKIKFPTSINSNEFYEQFKANIKIASLSYEKAIYVANKEKANEILTAEKKLSNNLRFG